MILRHRNIYMYLTQLYSYSQQLTYTNTKTPR